MKKVMLGALAALCAMLALPALASATPAHVTPQPVGNATITGGHTELTRTGGFTTGTSVTGSASFESTTTGQLQLLFHGVKSSIGSNCTNTGTTGTVTTTPLTFHVIQTTNPETGKPEPKLLITGGPTSTPETEGEGTWGHHFADFSCGIFIPTVQVRGTGIIGTITAPACDTKSNTATVKFEQEAVGVQKHRVWTGNSYDLEASLGGEYATAAMNAEATITFAGGATPELDCT